MNNELMTTFLNIVRTESITSAANKMYLSQSTVSQRLNKLEKNLGVKLIIRQKGIRGIILTDAGKRLLDLALKWESLVTETSLFNNDIKRERIVIGAVDSINENVLNKAYQKLQNNIPEIKIKIKTDHSDSLYYLLENNKIDVGFTLKKMYIKNLKVEKFHVEPMVHVQRIPDREKNDFKSKINHDSLISDHELYVDWGVDFKKWHENWWGKDSGGIQIDTAGLLSIFLENPNYWSIVPISIANKIKETQSDLNINHLKNPPPERICYKITSLETSNKSVVKKFEKILKNELINRTE